MLDLIIKKRNGLKITKNEFNSLILDIVNHKAPDYQLSALLMAIYFKGLDFKETTYLTSSMLHSGKTLNFGSRVTIDKHSTGGIGDKVSLIMAPLAASLGVSIPMIAGRGLGHTGGTIDKLESIKGFRTDLSLDEFKKLVLKKGLAITGQTTKIAPADKILYLLRDVTGTVESIPLITASIMSKKLAEGIKGLVLDIKCGSGAFMNNLHDARILTKYLTRVANDLGVNVYYVISDMNNPLGNYIGNALEIIESIEVLKGNIKNDLTELSLKLTAGMLLLANKTSSIDKGILLAKTNLENGKGLLKFREMVVSQNGDSSFIDDYSKFKLAPCCTIKSSGNGFIKKIDALTIGNIVKDIGGGRKVKNGKIDFGVGVVLLKKSGDQVKKGEPLATLYIRKKNNATLKKLENSFTITKTPPKLKLILEEGIKKIDRNN